MKRTVHNPNARAAQNYNIVEDLAQAPCSMSALEVLQSCPPQRKALLDSLGAVDPADTNILHFDLAHSAPRLHHRIAFQIQVRTKDTVIHHCVVDEGASTCIMSLNYWKALGSPVLVPSGSMLKAFDAHTFKPHGC